MGLTDELTPVLKKLRLSGVLQTIDLRTNEAVEGDLGYAEFLYRLLQDEVERREAKQLDLRLHRANFEQHKTVADFDFTFNKTVPKAKVIDLATCAFVRRRENLLLLGPAGVGKSHLAQAIGHRACLAGFKVIYTTADAIMKQLRAARGDGSYDRRMLRFTTPDLLVIDDLGLRPLTGEQPADLYEIIRERYERGSIIITSNRDAPELASLFGDPLLASAAMDRLMHHADVLVLEGESYRNPTNRRSRAKSKENST